MPWHVHAGGASRIVTIAPVVELSGVHFAALGLSDMLNGGGAVTACSLVPASALSDADGSGRWLGSLLQLPGSRELHGSSNGSRRNSQDNSADTSSSAVAALVRNLNFHCCIKQCSAGCVSHQSWMGCRQGAGRIGLSVSALWHDALCR